MIGFLKTETEGIELFYRFNYALKPRATVIIHHGFGEHLGRFEHVADYLLESGYNVMRFDARGHGLSKGPKGRLDSWKRFIEDLDRVYEETRQLSGNLPIFTLGHSMGGMVTLMYGLYAPEHLQGQIFTGAASGQLPYVEGPVSQAILSSADKHFPDKTFPNIVKEDVCSDPRVVEEYLNDPLVLKKVGFDFLKAFLIDSPQYIDKHLEDYQLPTLILHGEEDKIVPVQLSERLYARIASEDKTFKAYPELYHEILNEEVWPFILAEIVYWLNDRH